MIKFSPHLEVNVPQTDVHLNISKPATDWWVAGPTLAAVLISLIVGIMSFIFTRQQITLFEQQNSLAMSTAATDERPWLSVRSADISIDNPMQMPGVVIHIRNTGKTPALDVRSQQLPLVTTNLEITRTFTRDEIIRLGTNQRIIVAPNDEQNIIDLSFSGVGLPQPVASKFAAMPKAWAKGHIVIYGAVSYTDANQTKGFTQFCFLLLDNKVLGRCLSGNYME